MTNQQIVDHQQRLRIARISPQRQKDIDYLRINFCHIYHELLLKPLQRRPIRVLGRGGEGETSIKRINISRKFATQQQTTTDDATPRSDCPTVVNPAELNFTATLETLMGEWSGEKAVCAETCTWIAPPLPCLSLILHADGRTKSTLQYKMKRHWSEEIWESPPRSTTIRTAVGCKPHGMRDVAPYLTSTWHPWHVDFFFGQMQWLTRLSKRPLT